MAAATIPSTDAPFSLRRSSILNMRERSSPDSLIRIPKTGSREEIPPGTAYRLGIPGK
jgi:hypothetical protein